ncbi:M48 family metallopeptidase [Rhabdaerophilum calidifontis]|uniref:M48 family metallopeptidase n=1 Tax=Rhabdaerophilum calidifontis TaxID=2604328 RepID=UPI001239CE09|nr:M48 family metallopeptidase [Rhabdaerophilum calidifontis]
MPIGEAFGLYTHIRANRRRSAFLIAGLFVLVAMVTFGATLLMDAQLYRAPFPVLVRLAFQQMWLHLPIAFAATGLWVLVGFKLNTALVAWATGSVPVTRESNPRLYRLTENLCISRGMTVPRLQILETPALNAFASGVNENQYTVTVTSGLLEALDDAELEGVIAHELTHIRNGDVRLMIVAVLIAGVVSFFGEMLVRSRLRFGGGSGDDDRGSGRGLAVVVGIAILLLAWLFAVLIRFALSRSREYLADAGAVELTKNPDALISALLKISGRADIDGVPSGIMDMCIENDPDDFADIFSTHPSIAKRLNALQAYAGGRVPQAEPPRVEDRQSVAQIVERRGPWARGPGT